MHKFLTSYHPVNYACILCNSTCYMGTFTSLNDVTDTEAFNMTNKLYIYADCSFTAFCGWWLCS